MKNYGRSVCIGFDANSEEKEQFSYVVPDVTDGPNGTNGRGGFELRYMIKIDNSPQQQQIATSFLEKLQSFEPGTNAPDDLSISILYPPDFKSPYLGNQDQSKSNLLVNLYEATLTPLRVTLYPVEGGIAFKCGDDYLLLGTLHASHTQDFSNWIAERNKACGYELPTELRVKRPVEKISEFSFHTSQEMHEFHCAQANGKTFTGYQRNDQAGAITHQRAGSSHLIRMELTEEERAAGLALDYLESLARSQDADAILATEYILGVLAPPPHLPPRPYAGGWIDFNDVIKKIGWIPRNAKDRREMHAKIWSFVKFGEHAHIIGKRKGAKYQDGEGNPIDTTIHGAAWRVMKTETPDAPTLYAALETPVRAEIVVSKELTALISNPKTAQYLQCGEVLGAIPNGKPAGAWARVIGLALLSFWRRKPHEYNVGTLKPTRRQLLSHFAAKISPYEEILESNDPSRAIDYWCGALQILADERFIERTGEAAMSAKEMCAELPRKNWQDLWLNETVTIEIGAKTKPAFEKVLKSLYAPKPRDLKKKPRAPKRAKS